MKKENIILKIIGVIIIIISIFILPLKYKNKVEGKVIEADCYTTGDYRNRRRECFFRFKYTVDNKEYILEESNSAFLTSRKFKDQMIVVNYNPTNPAEALVNKNGRYFLAGFFALIGIIFLFAKPIPLDLLNQPTYYNTPIIQL